MLEAIKKARAQYPGSCNQLITYHVAGKLVKLKVAYGCWEALHILECFAGKPAKLTNGVATFTF